MKNKFNHERGQALILIVFAIVGLIGMTALAVDGGNAYSDRRHAQNAADTSVLAAARAKIRGDLGTTESDWKEAALAIATKNGYDDTDFTANSSSAINNVEVYICNEPDPNVDCGTYNDENHIQVKITSVVHTFFAPVVGVREVTNRVDAIAEVFPAYYHQMFNGNAVVGLNPHDCKAVKYQGNANTTISGGGIYVNSDCPSAAFFNQSGSAQLTAPSLCAAGGIQIGGSGINIPPENITEGCEPLGFPPASVSMPNPVCSGNATVDGTKMYPGTWDLGDFPPAGVQVLKPGIYCITNGNFRTNAGDILSGTSVLLRIDHGDITLNGGSTVQLKAIDEPGNTLHGLLIYMPFPSDPIHNCSNHTVTINGNAASYLVGTVLVPCADVKFDGTGDIPDMQGQLIGYTVDLSGTTEIGLNYNDMDNLDTLVSPAMNLTK